MFFSDPVVLGDISLTQEELQVVVAILDPEPLLSKLAAGRKLGF
jgi:hypothetical protein